MEKSRNYNKIKLRFELWKTIEILIDCNREEKFRKRKKTN